MALKFLEEVFKVSTKLQSVVSHGKPGERFLSTFSRNKISKGVIRRGYKFGHPMFGSDYDHPVPIGSDGLPVYVDWSLIPGAIWPAQDQRQTGMCYNFAAMGAISGLNFIENKDAFHPSSQQVLDCDIKTIVSDIRGGQPWDVMNFLKRTGGVLTKYRYPFTAKEDVYKVLQGPGISISGWKYVESNSEDALKYALAHQPIIVSLCFEDPVFLLGKLIDIDTYEGGVLYGPADGMLNQGVLNHCAVLVGYAKTDSGELFWKLLNSWGKFWGEDGFFYLSRGTGEPGGTLGILREPLVPLGIVRKKLLVSRCG